MHQVVRKCFNNKYFPFLICGLAAAFWLINLYEAGAFIIAAVGLVSLYFTDDLKDLIASSLVAALAVRAQGMNFHPLALILAAILLAALATCSFIYFFKKNTWFKNQKIKTGSMMVPLILVGIAGFLGGLGFSGYNHLKVFQLLYKLIAIYALYFVTINFVKEDSTEFFAKVIVLIGAVVIFEVWVTFFNCADFWDAVRAKNSRLGWGNHNIVAQVISITIPMLAYLAYLKKNRRLVYLGLMFIYFLNIMLLLSRTNILISIITIAFSVYFIFYKTDRAERKKIALFIGALLLIFAVAFIILYNRLGEDWFSERFFDNKDSGRLKLYKEAWGYFKENPIFGIGLYITEGVKTLANYNSGVYLYHNTVMNILACTGLVGLLLCAPLFYKRYKLIFGRTCAFVFFAALSVFAFETYGLMDISFLHFYHNMFLFLLLALVEKCPEEKNGLFKTVFSK